MSSNSQEGQNHNTHSRQDSQPQEEAKDPSHHDNTSLRNSHIDQQPSRHHSITDGENLENSKRQITEDHPGSDKQIDVEPSGAPQPQSSNREQDKEPIQLARQQYLNQSLIHQLKESKRSQQGSPTKQSTKVHHQQLSYSSHLRTIFEHYSKISYTTGPNMTFDRLQHQTHILTINKFMIWAKEFKVTGNVPIVKLMEIFKRSGNSHKQLEFNEFGVAIEKLSEVMFQGDDRLDQMKSLLGLTSEATFRQKCRQLHICGAKSISSMIKMRKSKEGSVSKLKPLDSQTPQPRIMKIRSQYIRNKAMSHLQRNYPMAQQSGRQTERDKKQKIMGQLKEINSSIKVRQSKLKQEPSESKKKQPAIIQQNKETGRYSRAKSTVDKYKISTIISQAKNQVRKVSKKQKSLLDNSPPKANNKKETKAKDGVLEKLLGMDEDQDQFLANYEHAENITKGRRIPQGISKRIEQIRRIDYKK